MADPNNSTSSAKVAKFDSKMSLQPVSSFKESTQQNPESANVMCPECEQGSTSNVADEFLRTGLSKATITDFKETHAAVDNDNRKAKISKQCSDEESEDDYVSSSDLPESSASSKEKSDDGNASEDESDDEVSPSVRFESNVIESSSSLVDTKPSVKVVESKNDGDFGSLGFGSFPNVNDGATGPDESGDEQEDDEVGSDDDESGAKEMTLNDMLKASEGMSYMSMLKDRIGTLPPLNDVAGALSTIHIANDDVQVGDDQTNDGDLSSSLAISKVVGTANEGVSVDAGAERDVGGGVDNGDGGEVGVEVEDEEETEKVEAEMV
ncbi:hypothetical protein HDU76_002475 [Blyttiomyces sp. JEL0837]|nr:hypothetical protein HDU76_002475 [Blyttiomyces sp. JEL0837]